MLKKEHSKNAVKINFFFFFLNKWKCLFAPVKKTETEDCLFPWGRLCFESNMRIERTTNLPNWTKLFSAEAKISRILGKFISECQAHWSTRKQGCWIQLNEISSLIGVVAENFTRHFSLKICKSKRASCSKIMRQHTHSTILIANFNDKNLSTYQCSCPSNTKQCSLIQT